tara:strand:- start:26 stop:820 length:795 start_codon:yes stop_codon:yes gene_type:complete
MKLKVEVEDSHVAALEGKLFGLLIPVWYSIKDAEMYLLDGYTSEEADRQPDYLTNTRKMPHPSFGFSMINCKAGQFFAKISGTICAICYGDKCNYQYPDYKTKSSRTIKSTKKPFWKEAMSFILAEHGWDSFRWFDNGDLQDVKMLEDIIWIADQNPKTEFWLPTKEYTMVKKYINGGGHVPRNLDIRISGLFTDGRDLEQKMILAHALGLNVSAALDTELFQWMPKSNQVKCHTAKSILGDDNCGDCRACWKQPVFIILYEVH